MLARRDLFEPADRGHHFFVPDAAVAVLARSVRRHREIERMARMWATRQRKSTGASGSPFSSSPLAGHIPHIDFSSHIVHLVGRVIFRRRTGEQRAVPAVAQRSAPQVEFVLLRQHADAESTLGIDGKRADAAAAVIHLVRSASGGFAGPGSPWQSPSRRPSGGGSSRSSATQSSGRQTHGERALRAVDPRIHHAVEFEFDAEVRRRTAACRAVRAR